MIFLKSNSDILQGISKLDNIIKCSGFQKYRVDEESKINYSLATEDPMIGNSNVSIAESLTSEDYNQKVESMYKRS